MSPLTSNVLGHCLLFLLAKESRVNPRFCDHHLYSFLIRYEIIVFQPDTLL